MSYLSDHRPDFYKYFNFKPFSSPLSFSELTRILPFSLNDQLQITSPIQEISLAEREHTTIHRDILAVYAEHNLPPLPPWLLLQKVGEGHLQLSRLFKKLEAATPKT